MYSVIYEKNDCKALGLNQTNKNCDELERLRSLWSDTEYLSEFYAENQKYFEQHYWVGISLEDFVLGVISNVPKILCEIERKYINNKQKELFLPLDNRQYKNDILLLEMKAKFGCVKDKLAIRLYAIRLSKNEYIITGGAIKLTKKMSDHPDTKLEREKIRYVVNYLKSEGVFDEDSFKDLI